MYFENKYDDNVAGAKAEGGTAFCGGQNTYGFGTVHFIETRKYLLQVRDGKHRVELLKGRINYRENAGMPTDYLEEELDEAKQNLKVSIAEVAEEISKLHDIGQEMVLTRRYIDTMTWDQVAASLDMKMRTVQKFHGNALPAMERVLLDDGRIGLEAGEGGGKSAENEPKRTFAPSGFTR